MCGYPMGCPCVGPPWGGYTPWGVPMCGYPKGCPCVGPPWGGYTSWGAHVWVPHGVGTPWGTPCVGQVPLARSGTHVGPTCKGRDPLRMVHLHIYIYKYPATDKGPWALLSSSNVGWVSGSGSGDPGGDCPSRISSSRCCSALMRARIAASCASCVH